MKKKPHAKPTKSKSKAKPTRKSGKGIFGKRSSKGKSGTKNKALSISSKSKVPKKSQRTHARFTKTRFATRFTKTRFAKYSTGIGKNKNQITYWFPDIAESKKVANLRSWDGEPLQKYINKNRPVFRKAGRVMSETGEPVLDPLAGYKAPQAVWVKLVKRKPRNKELFFSSTLSNPEMIVNRANTLSFSVGVLEKYYADHPSSKIDRIKDKIEVDKTLKPYKQTDSDPDDYEGKPMKIVAVIYHFLY